MFVSPGTTNPTVVESFSFDAGYFDIIGSVRVVAFDLAGNLLTSTTNKGFGIENLSIDGGGIASFEIQLLDSADAYAIDNFVSEPMDDTPSLSPTCIDPDPVFGCGDPHFKTWGGHKYDWHGICDSVLLTNPDFAHGLGMDIHIRTKQVPDTPGAFIESAVVRIGDETLEVMAGKEHQAWINGKKDSTLLSTGNATIGGYPITYEDYNSKRNSRACFIHLGNGAFIKLQTFKYFLNVRLLPGKGDNFIGSLGLLGSRYDGTMVGRDGLTIFDDPNEFGQEWQVRAGEEAMLFHNVDGPQYPAPCELPWNDQVTSRRGRRLLDSAEKRKIAEEACVVAEEEDFEDCVYDVVITDDVEMAHNYGGDVDSEPGAV